MANKVGRPKIELDQEELKKLAAMGCTMIEMASFFNCSVDTLENNFSDIIREGREKGKSSVRRMMWRHGENGNSVALKYLVHNVLKEKIEDNTIIQTDKRFDLDERLDRITKLVE